MESWAFAYGDEEFVLRRLPAGITEDEEGFGGIPLSLQAKVIDAAYESNVTAPQVRAVLTAADGLGQGFIMDRAKGETLPHKIMGNHKFSSVMSKLTQQCAAELWHIHNIAKERIPSGLNAYSPKQLVSLQKQKYHQIGGKIPIFDFTLRWLEQNAPEDGARTLVHGDFRMGNLMIDHDGITAVLDWELCRLGDPVQDLAYFCTPSWRFGNYEKQAGGFDTSENFLTAYAKLSGKPVDPVQFHFWLVYSTLWWGVVCLVMGDIWRSGSDRSLERTVIGRRVSEVEVDLALLFSEIMPAQFGSPLKWTLPESQATTGETSYEELLIALGEWNNENVLPSASGHNKFQSRVASNALGIAKRYAKWWPTFNAAATQRLAAIGYDNAQLCEYLANDSAGVIPETYHHLRLSALERCTIDQPKYAGLKVALEQWNRS